MDTLDLIFRALRAIDLLLTRPVLIALARYRATN